MKKLFAILLVLAMLIPMGTVVQAAETTETKPFYHVNWSYFDSELDNVYGMPYFWAYGLQPGDTVGKMAWNNETNITKLAENLKEEFDARPEGSRYINFCLPSTAFHDLAEDVVFVEKAIPVVQDWLDEFLTEYKSIGGKLDGLVVDVEFEDLYSVYIHSRFYVKDQFVYDKIVKNPAYQTKIRPQLEARGFKFYPNVTEFTPEIYSIHPNSGTEYAQSRKIWDAVLRSYMNTSVTEACSTVWKYYPEANVSDYQSKNIKSWLKETNDTGGIEGGGGNFTGAGNSSNENTYFVRPYNFFTNVSNQGPAYKTLPGHNWAVYENKPFNYFKYDANLMKNTYLASDDGEISFWIAYYMYNKSNKNAVCGTPYYAEQLIHMGMLNPQVFLGYIIPNEVGDYDEYELGLQIIDDVMKELTRVVGGADRKPIGVVPMWNDSFILSGMNVGGKNIWRLTPDTSKVTVADFQVQGASDLTFSVCGETITFPQGKIIADGNVTKIGTCGYWIETPENVTPVISRMANYHEVYPAFAETYQQYAVGTEYTFKNALPEATWEVKKSGNESSAIVQADPNNAGNQVLALKGNYTLRNVTMPKNITAGDTYAENQAWEVCVTVPADMAADAEVILLNASSDKKKSEDGGFKIAGGKIYYSKYNSETKAGEYVEIPGLVVNGGVQYRLKREVNFTNADAFTSNYYVYDAAGTLLARFVNVPMAPVDLPVEVIGMSCSKVAGEAVLLDNYKLYPTRVAADFELYDAATGMQVTNVDAARNANTAYRLSWMNASETEKTYSVVAAYGDGTEAVIKQVKMAPNTEGIETGVVEGSDSKTVRVYLRCDSPADPEEGNFLPGDNVGGTNTKPGGKLDTTMLILIVAAAVVVVGAVVVVLLSNQKSAKAKKAKKAAAISVEEVSVEEESEEEAPAEEEPAAEETPETDAE